MKKKKNGKTGIISGVAVLVVVVALVAYHYLPQLKTLVGISDTSSINDTGMNEGGAPWPAEISHLKDRLNADSLAILSEEGQALHIHQHLDIYLDGIPLQVPAGIGINEKQNFISPIHTHDLTGIIHVESPTIADFTLGQFFDVWGVAFSDSRIGGYYNTEEKTLRVYVNGQPYQGDPRALVLAAHQEIVIVYGTDSEVPAVIPSAYTFPVTY